MAQTVGQHTVAAFTSPLNGTSPIDANTVRGNDNTLRTGYNDHDADPGIHLQSSLLASRPSAGEAGRKWLTTDTGALKIFFDTGSTWAEISYLPISGGTVSGTLTVTGALTASGGVVGNVTGNVTGNASTATALQTARTINGVSFDGTANITVTADAGTLTGSTLASGVTASSLTSVGTLTSGAIGTGFTAIPNTALANSSVTINGTSVALGASGTVTAAAGTLTGTTLASGVTASSLTSVGTLTSLAVSGTTTLNTVAYTWPSADGTNGYVLSTNGSGTLAWVAQSGGGGGTTTNSLTAGSFLTGGSFNGSTAVTFAVDATDASTASKVVARDANGASSFDAVKLDGSTSGTVTVQGAATAGTWTLTLPTGAGSSGQALSTNGSGVTSWASYATDFSDSTINPTASAPYSISNTDVNKRLVIGPTSFRPIINFTTANTSSIAVGSRIKIAAFNSTVALNSTYADTVNNQYNPTWSASSSVQAFAEQPDGKFLVGGTFTTVAGVSRSYLARINPDGSVDTTFDAGITGSNVFRIFVHPSGKIYVAGSFTTIGGSTVTNYAHLFPNGRNDTTRTISFNTVSGTLNFTFQANGKTLTGGGFTTAGGVTRNRLARWSGDDTLESFNPNFNSDTYKTIVLSSGKILVCGAFTTVGGTSQPYLARLNDDGTLDTAFAPSVSDAVLDMAVQSDDKILIVGNFTTVGGTTRNYIARLNANGTLDTGFNPDSSGAIQSIILLADGSMLVRGTFATFVGGTVTRNGFARLNSDGTVNASYSSSATGLGSTLSGIAVYRDMYAVVFGSFNNQNVAGTNRTNLAVAGSFSNASGTDLFISFPSFTQQPQIPKNSVVTIEKVASDRWVVVENNAS